jgi:hypothetical protein
VRTRSSSILWSPSRGQDAGLAAKDVQADCIGRVWDGLGWDSEVAAPRLRRDKVVGEDEAGLRRVCRRRARWEAWRHEA